MCSSVAVVQHDVDIMCNHMSACALQTVHELRCRSSRLRIVLLSRDSSSAIHTVSCMGTDSHCCNARRPDQSCAVQNIRGGC